MLWVLAARRQLARDGQALAIAGTEPGCTGLNRKAVKSAMALVAAFTKLLRHPDSDSRRVRRGLST
jgi:hypothetical protein